MQCGETGDRRDIPHFNHGTATLYSLVDPHPGQRFEEPHVYG
jgi:hypothetical protein